MYMHISDVKVFMPVCTQRPKGGVRSLRTGLRGVFWVPNLGLGIPTQVLMIAQKMLLTTDLSFQFWQQRL